MTGPGRGRPAGRAATAGRAGAARRRAGSGRRPRCTRRPARPCVQYADEDVRRSRPRPRRAGRPSAAARSLLMPWIADASAGIAHARVGQPFAAVRTGSPSLTSIDRARDDPRLARVRPGRLQVEADQQLPVPAHAWPPFLRGAFPQWSPPSHAPLTIRGPRSASRHGSRLERTGRFRTPAASPPRPTRTPRGRSGTARARRRRPRVTTARPPPRSTSTGASMPRARRRYDWTTARPSGPSPSTR